uniref:NACHT domain-containing protein n=1 Tax=Periophthalmus magnuspinnatus TaxID=409849 RepID=A0A3B4AKH7_9GOBI
EEAENAQIVLNQEYPELLHILTHQPSTTLKELCALPLTSNAGVVICPTSSPAAMAKDVLDYYRSAESSMCRDFLQRICMLCENIPMWLESRLMSVSGSPTSKYLDVECGFSEARVTLDTFLQGSTGKVTILYGKPGSGKTIHMSHLGELWACDLGHIPSSHLFILLEFRHLNLLSQTLSFYDLLFQYYPSPQGGEDEKIAIVDYLLSNPEQSCWILDGYDEFQFNLYKRDYNNAQLDPRSPRPVAELIAALLHRHILPGCTVVFTCRVRDVTDLERKAEKVGELLPWNHHKIKEYVHKYFQHKGNLAAGKHATKLLFSNKRLVAMSSIPALCNISCIYLKKHNKEMQSILQMPSTLTGVYLTSIGTFLSHLNQEKSAEVSELFELAWNGLETGKIVFLEEEIPHRILHFSIVAGFISENGILVNVYCFAHLTVQEFLSALKIMTSVDDKELKNRLKTRWPSKSDQKTVFTNSLHRFLSGLASPHCSALLALLTKEDHSFVHKRQETVKKWLQQMCHTHMTGPKVLELCHCVQESQDKQLSKQLMSVKPKLELHNITLSPNDLDALAFVVNSSEERNIALDFRACSIELDGLELLSQCDTITNLSFHSRKYEDSFAEKLSTILPKLSSLKKLSAIGAAHLASALVECRCITEINFSGNNLRDDGTKHITDILPKLPQLSFVNLGQNNSSLQAAVYLTKEIASMNVQRIYIECVFCFLITKIMLICLQFFSSSLKW